MISGVESISIFNFAAASSIKSIALSGKNLSEMYRQTMLLLRQSLDQKFQLHDVPHTFPVIL